MGNKIVSTKKAKKLTSAELRKKKKDRMARRKRGEEVSNSMQISNKFIRASTNSSIGFQRRGRLDGWTKKEFVSSALARIWSGVLDVYYEAVFLRLENRPK
jgi:hypothetical protein